MAKGRTRKRYTDHYGKNRPLQPFQGRCANRVCSIAVYKPTLVEGGGLCPHCADKQRQKDHFKAVESRLQEATG